MTNCQNTQKNPFQKKIYKGIWVENLKVKRKEVIKDKTENKVILFTVSMDTAEGEISFSHEVKLVQEKDGDKKSWKINWTPDFIFPGMKKIIKSVCRQSKEKTTFIYGCSLFLKEFWLFVFRGIDSFGV